jgi:hypothetical protein
MDVVKASKLAVGNVLKEGLTDIFSVPKELNLLKSVAFQNLVVESVARCIRGNSLDSLAIAPISYVLLPKGGPFDFRRCALIEPLDTIKYLALVLTLADGIEKHRLANRTHTVFSYRFSPKSGYLFDRRYDITAFRKETAKRALLKTSRFLVACDIANFYDRLNIHRLESTLLSLGLDKIRVKQINELLLFWANRDSYGLPVGSNASRILAEVALLEVDRYLLSIGARFIRFVDDYRLFAPDVHTAHRWLTQLIERLWLEGLTINKGKTKIEEITDIENGKENAAAARRLHQDKRKAKPGQDHLEGRSQFRLIAGYGGIIPTRFRVPASKELEKLKLSDVGLKLRDLKKKKLPTPEDITDFVKSVIGTQRYGMFVELPEIVDLFPQFTPYAVDVLCKYESDIGARERRAIRDKFARRLKERQRLPEYITIEIVRLLGSKGYADKDTLLDFFRKLQRNAGSYIGRALLDALEDHVSRGEVLEIRDYFIRADAWEKREIVAIVDKHLTEEEKRPWLKNIRTQESRDLFLVEYIKPARKP